MDDIVSHAGGSKASIYKYFGNKEGLFTAICDYRREVFFNGVCLPYSPDCVSLNHYLTQTLQRFYHHIIKPENIAFMRMFTEQTQKDAQLANYFYDKCAVNVQIQLHVHYINPISKMKSSVHNHIISNNVFRYFT